MNDIEDPVFELGEVGVDQPQPPEPRQPRRAAGRVAMVLGLLVVMATLSVATIRVIAVDRGSSRSGASDEIVEAGPTYDHQTPNTYEPPTYDSIDHPVDPLPSDVVIDLTTGETFALPRQIRAISGAEANYDVSPDGTLIAFEAEDAHVHQLWVAEIDGTHAHPALDRSMIAITPAWSPDGTQIVFEGTDEDLFVLDVESRAVRRVFDGDWLEEVWLPSFHPDGHAILFTRATDRGRRLGLWTVPTTGGAPKLVRSNAAFGAYSPDGSTIAYHRIAGRGDTYWFPFDFGISLLDTQTGERSGLHVKNAGCCTMNDYYDWNWTRPVWSTDGSMLGFQAFGQRDGDIYVVEVATREATTIGAGAYPTWVDDHTLIVEDYDPPADGFAIPVGPVEIGEVDAIVDLPSGEATTLPDPIAEIAHSHPHYAVSPDGGRLAFVGLTPSDGWQIHVANLDGSHVRAVTSDASEAASPAWSPDGTEIAYEPGGSGGHNLAVVNVRTGRTRPVVRGPSGLDEQAWAPSFSPDGRTILFTVRWNSKELTSDLWSVPATGGRPTRVLSRAALAAYSPDGESIAYRRARSMLSTWVRVSDLDGSHVRRFGRLVWVWRPEWPLFGAPAWSSDGTRLAFQSDAGHDGPQVVVANLASGGFRVIGSGERPVWLDDDTLIVDGVGS